MIRFQIRKFAGIFTGILVRTSHFRTLVVLTLTVFRSCHIKYYPVSAYLMLASAILPGRTAHSIQEDSRHLSINLHADEQRHIKFKRITPNTLSLSKTGLSIKVNESASFILLPFKKIRHTTGVNFDWRSQGELRIADARTEATREGDDARLRVGLILKGDSQPFFNPLAPEWVKIVNDSLYFPYKNLVYLIAGARHPPASRWINPYNEKVSMISIPSEPLDQGWLKATYRFEAPLAVIGLWIMADGDNTGSTFTTELKNLQLEITP